MARIENLPGCQLSNLTLPSFEEIFEVGFTLPDGIDLDRLENSLKEFYDGRLTLVRDSDPIPSDAPSNPPEVVVPAQKRTRSKK